MLYYGVDVSSAVECILSKAVSTSLCCGTIAMCIYIYILNTDTDTILIYLYMILYTYIF